MPVLHVIDAARIAHETVRGYFAPVTARREITATWGDLPQDQRDASVAAALRIIDKEFEPLNDVDRLRIAVINALRPFLEE